MTETNETALPPIEWPVDPTPPTLDTYHTIVLTGGGRLHHQPIERGTADDVIAVFATEPTEAEIDAALGETGLALARAAALARLSSACGAAIVAGYGCDALGAVHLYPSAETDQTNLLGMVLSAQIGGAGWSGDFACRDGSGAWARRTHTATQITAVGLAGAAHKASSLLQLDLLRLDVAAATTVAAINAIAWEG